MSKFKEDHLHGLFKVSYSSRLAWSFGPRPRPRPTEPTPFSIYMSSFDRDHHHDLHPFQYIYLLHLSITLMFIQYNCFKRSISSSLLWPLPWPTEPTPFSIYMSSFDHDHHHDLHNLHPFQYIYLLHISITLMFIQYNCFKRSISSFLLWPLPRPTEPTPFSIYMSSFDRDHHHDLHNLHLFQYICPVWTMTTTMTYTTYTLFNIYIFYI